MARRERPSVGGKIETTTKTKNQARRLFFFKVETVIIFNFTKPVRIKGNSKRSPRREEVINISDK